jgi:hypothetical protein
MGGGKFENRYFRFEKSVKNGIMKLSMLYSRRAANRLRKQVVQAKGETVLNRKLKGAIKAYSRERFGTKAYWPYLAYYAEIRGEYVDGWIPYDYYRYMMLPKINPQYSCEISEHKTYDHMVFGDFAIRPLYIFVSGMFLDAEFKKVGTEQVMKFLAEYKENIVVKEERGTHGLQVRMIHSSEFKMDSINKNVNYIIQPHVKQYSVINDLYPDSVNTFRVISYLRPDGSVVIKSSILRFGVDGSKIDNLSARGQFIYFDEIGKPSEQAYDLLGLPTGVRHKNTGFKYSDFSIPMYEEVMEACKTAHMRYPYIRLVGWDVCVDEHGKPTLIEWNADNPGFHPEEALFGPFYPDDDEILLK